MFNILINEERFQTHVFANIQHNSIKVDCLAPSENHKLKTDYLDFAGVDQWELDTAKQAIELKANAYKAYTAQELSLKSEDELNLHKLKIGKITQNEYDARLLVIIADSISNETRYGDV